jgi:hypothetical protein
VPPRAQCDMKDRSGAKDISRMRGMLLDLKHNPKEQ